MVDVIRAPLSPATALARLERLARNWNASSLPQRLRDRRVVGLTFAKTTDGFRLQLKTANRRSIECIGHFAATPSGCTLTYEIVSDRPSRFRRAVIGAGWLGVLVYFLFHRSLTLSLFMLAVVMFAFTALGGGGRPSSKLRVGIYEMLSSALEGSGFVAAT